MTNLVINENNNLDIIKNNWELNIVLYYSDIFTDNELIKKIHDLKENFKILAKEFENNKNIKFFIINIDNDERTWNYFNLFSIPSIQFIRYNLKIADLAWFPTNKEIKEKIEELLKNS